MKICIINTLFIPYHVGGAEVSVALLAEKLANDEHDVCVITLHPSGEEKIFHHNRVKVRQLPLDNIYWPFAKKRPHALQRLLWHLRDIWNFKSAQRVGRILDEEKPDILHTNNLQGFSVSVWNEARKRKIKTVHSLRDYALLCPRAALFRKGKNCATRCLSCTTLSWLKKLATRHVSEVVGVSRHILDTHTSYGFFPKAAPHVIFNAADILSVASIPKLPSSIIRFGFIGRLVEEKGIETLLRATVRLPKSGWSLLVAGEGEEKYIRRLQAINPASSISWAGFMPAGEFYRQIDVLVVPSLWAEPLTRSVIEAGGRSIPVIAADTGGTRELLAAGITGDLFVPGDEKQLTQLMQDYIDNPAKHTEVQQEWQDEFAPSTVAMRYLASYGGKKSA